MVCLPLEHAVGNEDHHSTRQMPEVVMAERWVLLLPRLAAEGNRPVEEARQLAVQSQCQIPYCT